jgi:general stress protein 26
MVQPIMEPETFTIWLGTNPALRKVREIEENSNVTLAFGSDSSNANLIIYGQAQIVQDVSIRKKHWINSWILFFPHGPKGDDFVSIKIEIREMELMSFKENIVPEPFGLKPVRIQKETEGWKII